MAVALSGSTLSSQLFDDLAGYLSNPSGVEAFLVSQGVDARIAQAIATAIAAADGTPVTVASGTTLNQILQAFVPSVTIPSTWSIGAFATLTFSCSAAGTDGQRLSFAGTLSAPVDVTIQDLQLQFTASLTLAYALPTGATKGTTTGALAGTVGFAGQDFSAAYDFGADGQTITASWSPTDGTTLGLTPILQQFNLGPLATATDDVLKVLALQSATFTLDLSATDTISIDATAARGNAFVAAQYNNGWTVATGVELTDITIDKLPLFGDALGDTTGLDLGFQLPAAVVLAASGPMPNFAVPNRSGDDTSWPFDSFPLDVQSGVVLAAVLDLSASRAKVAGNLLKILPSSGQLLLEATLPDLTLRVDLGTDLKILRRIEFDASLEFAAPFDVSLQGTLTIPGNSRMGNFSCAAGIELTPETAMGFLKLDDSDPFNPPLGFLTGVWLYELAGMIGLDFDKQEATIGLMGKFQIGAKPPSGGDGSGYKNAVQAMVGGVIAQQAQTAQLDLDEFAVIVGVNDDLVVLPIPDIDLLMLKMSTLSLQSLMVAVLGSDAPSATADVFSHLSVNGLQVYWCDDAPDGLMLPDGTQPTSGFRFRGLFDVWTFQAWVELEAALKSDLTASDISGQLYLSPIDIGGMLHVTNDGAVAPADVLARIKQAGLDQTGPFLTFSTQSPFLSASCEVRLVDLTETVDVTLTSDGCSLNLATQEGSAFSGEFQCVVTNDWKTLTVQLDGNLDGLLTLPVVVGLALGDVGVGPDDIEAAFSASMVVDVSDGFALTLDGTFSFDGDTHRWTLPHIALDVPFTRLEDIPETMLEWIGKEAMSVFEDAVIASSKVIIKYVDKAWDDVEGEVAAAYGDIVHAIGRFFGIHKAKRPSAPWLRDGALISAQGSTVPTDSTDPNYSTLSIYVVRHLQRVYVPDPQTLGQIDSDASGDLFTGTKDGFDPDYVITIPVAPFEYPSVVDGVFFYRYDGDQSNQSLYLSISTFDHSHNVQYGHYQVASDGHVWTDLATYQSQVTLYPVQKLPCNPGDTPGDGNTPLASVCLITDETNIPKDMFFDGLRRHVPDPATWAILDQKHYGTATMLPTSAFNGIPAGAALPSLANGMLVTTGEAVGTPIYYITGNQLCHVPNPQDLDDWFSGMTATTIDVQAFSVLAIGPELKKNPNAN